MRRPAPVARPICPMCFEPGIHGSEQKCIDNLRAEIDKLRQQLAHLSQEGAVTVLRRT